MAKGYSRVTPTCSPALVLQVNMQVDAREGSELPSDKKKKKKRSRLPLSIVSLLTSHLLPNGEPQLYRPAMQAESGDKLLDYKCVVGVV